MQRDYYSPPVDRRIDNLTNLLLILSGVLLSESYGRRYKSRASGDRSEIGRCEMFAKSLHMTSVPSNNPDHSQYGISHDGAQGIVPAPEGCVQPQKHAVGAGSTEDA